MLINVSQCHIYVWNMTYCVSWCRFRWGRTERRCREPRKWRCKQHLYERPLTSKSLWWSWPGWYHVICIIQTMRPWPLLTFLRILFCSNYNDLTGFKILCIIINDCVFKIYYLKYIETSAGEDETGHNQNICARALYDYQAGECLNFAVLSKKSCNKWSICSKVLISAMSCNIWTGAIALMIPYSTSFAQTSGFSIKLCISRKPVVFSNYCACPPHIPLKWEKN